MIRRREETAATRSLLNTAKVMEDNPIALRMKELETLEKVTEKIDKISVYGGLDGVLKDLVKIRAYQPASRSGVKRASYVQVLLTSTYGDQTRTAAAARYGAC